MSFRKRQLFRQSVVHHMGDSDWEDVEWANELLDEMEAAPAAPAPAPAPARAHAPKRATGDARKLDWCTDDTPAKVLSALEDIDLYRKVQTFTNLMHFMFKKSNDGFHIWEHLKPYHANLLAYHAAAGIQAGTLEDVKMLRAAYETVIRVLQDSVRSVNSGSLYTQWVGRETREEFTNIGIIFKFLRERDDAIKSTAGPGKLP